MREQLPEGEGEGCERSKIDPTRSLLTLEQHALRAYELRFHCERPADLGTANFHEGDEMREAVKAIFDDMDRENEPKVTYEGRLSEHHKTLKFYDDDLFRQIATPDEGSHGTGQPKEGVYTLEIGDYLTVYGEDDAVIWQGRVPLRAGAGIDEGYLRSMKTHPEIFKGWFASGFRATLVTRNRNAQQNAK